MHQKAHRNLNPQAAELHGTNWTTKPSLPQEHGHHWPTSYALAYCPWRLKTQPTHTVRYLHGSSQRFPPRTQEMVTPPPQKGMVRKKLGNATSQHAKPMCVLWNGNVWRRERTGPMFLESTPHPVLQISVSQRLKTPAPAFLNLLYFLSLSLPHAAKTIHSTGKHVSMHAVVLLWARIQRLGY